MKKLYYIVHLKEDIEPLFKKTTCAYKFCGELIKEENDTLYFKLNYSKALVIIPYKWIKWMAPSNLLYKRGKNKNYD